MAKNVYIQIERKNARHVTFTDKNGEPKAFWSVTLPKGTEIDGKDLSWYQFSPKFVNDAKFAGPEFYDIPLLADRNVYLSKDLWDKEKKQVVRDENGNKVKDRVMVSPIALQAAISQARKATVQPIEVELNQSELDELEKARADYKALEEAEPIPF